MDLVEPRAVWHADARLTVQVGDEPWTLNPEMQRAIETEWETLRDRFFRGPVLSLVGVQPTVAGTKLDARWTDYAHFLYSFRQIPIRHPAYVRVLCAVACLVTSDGYFLAGQMGMHTARPGWIQAVGGSAEPGEVVAGRFDAVSSAVRELREETGLDVEEPGLVADFGVAGYTQDERDGSVAIGVKILLNLTHRDAIARFQEFRSKRSVTELDDLAAIPLGPEGVQWLTAYAGSKVRYLSALVQAPELLPD